MDGDRAYPCYANFAPEAPEAKTAVTDTGIGVSPAEERRFEEPPCLGVCERDPGADTIAGHWPGLRFGAGVLHVGNASVFVLRSPSDGQR